MRQTPQGTWRKEGSLPAGGGRSVEMINISPISNDNIDHLPDIGDSGIAADARGVDGQPAGGGGGGGD